ncbi:MAG: pyruvate kinase, partial [Spirochaetaceae bacterium]|nr:pyruvate kinase [Spirochaetaceae bacterium]
MNRTKIVATLSGNRSSEEFIAQIIEAGANVFRLNTAHQELKDAAELIQRIRNVSNNVGILLDTKGPEIRTVDVENPIDVKEGDEIAIIGKDKNLDIPHFKISYMGFSKKIKRGQEILLDDGELSFTVMDIRSDRLICIANNHGEIKNKKGVNVPNIDVDLPSITEKDDLFIRFAAENNIDFIAHSFVRNEEDVLAVQRILDQYNSPIKIIAKIENRQGLDNLKEILNSAAGVMVARGDLGIELPAAEVPLYQKRIIRSCIKRGKIAITATQMLHSMITNPRPTRAEVSDVANAVMDGTDALMLSGETAYGDYPLESVRVMANIASTIEAKYRNYQKKPKLKALNPIRYQLIKSAVDTAEALKAKSIIVQTMTGRSAILLAAQRGITPIKALCEEEYLMRHFSLVYGVEAFHLPRQSTIDTLISKSLEILLRNNSVMKNDLVVMV